MEHALGIRLLNESFQKRKEKNKENLKYLLTSETISSWLSIFEVCVVVDHVAETNVVEVVLVTKDNQKFLFNHQKFPRAHQTSEIELAQHAVELDLRDSAVVDSVVVLK